MKKQSPKRNASRVTKDKNDAFTKELLCAIFDIRKHIAKLLWARRFSVVKMMAMHIIWMREGVSVEDLAEQIGISAPSTSVMVQDLVAKGIAERQTEERDRRKVRIVLTPKGKRAMERTMMEVTATLFKGVSDTDAREYLRILRTIGSRK